MLSSNETQLVRHKIQKINLDLVVETYCWSIIKSSKRFEVSFPRKCIIKYSHRLQVDMRFRHKNITLT